MSNTKAPYPGKGFALSQVVSCKSAEARLSITKKKDYRSVLGLEVTVPKLLGLGSSESGVLLRRLVMSPRLRCLCLRLYWNSAYSYNGTQQDTRHSTTSEELLSACTEDSPPTLLKKSLLKTCSWETSKQPRQN